MIDLDTLMLAAKIGGGGGGGGGTGTAYIDVSMTSETEFEMSFKGEDIDAAGIADLVDSGFSVIAKVNTSPHSTQFIPLINIETSGKTVVNFGTVAVLGDDAAGFLIATNSSDDGNVGSVSIIPL